MNDNTQENKSRQDRLRRRLAEANMECLRSHYEASESLRRQQGPTRMRVLRLVSCFAFGFFLGLAMNALGYSTDEWPTWLIGVIGALVIARVTEGLT